MTGFASTNAFHQIGLIQAVVEEVVLRRVHHAVHLFESLVQQLLGKYLFLFLRLRLMSTARSLLHSFRAQQSSQNPLSLQVRDRVCKAYRKRKALRKGKAIKKNGSPKTRQIVPVLGSQQRTPFPSPNPCCMCRRGDDPEGNHMEQQRGQSAAPV